MYKDREVQKEAVKRAVEKHRVLQKGITSEGITGQGITYPAIIVALADQEKRDKLTRITNQLKSGRLLDKVNYGIGGPTFLEVDKMLTCLE